MKTAENMRKTIRPDQLICLDGAKPGALRIELAYSRPDNLLFGEAIYRPDARLWLFEDMAKIVLGAATLLFAQGLRLVVYDGLRTIDAQARMLETQRVKDNPHWLEEPRLLSPPGAGGHPRGMAVDVALETLDGVLLDMGTPFDYLAENAAPEHNCAHRQHQYLTSEVKHNRALLDEAMMGAAKMLNLPLCPLPQEWWDFRFPAEIYEQYAPLSDTDLPQEMRLIS